MSFELEEQYKKHVEECRANELKEFTLEQFIILQYVPTRVQQAYQEMMK